MSEKRSSLSPLVVICSKGSASEIKDKENKSLLNGLVLSKVKWFGSLKRKKEEKLSLSHEKPRPRNTYPITLKICVDISHPNVALTL